MKVKCLKNVLETKSDTKLVENFIPCMTNVFLVERKRLPSEPLDIIFEQCTCWNHICTYLMSYLYMLESHLYILGVLFVYAGSIFVQYTWAGTQSVCRRDRLSVAYLTPCMRNVSLSHHHHHHHQHQH